MRILIPVDGSAHSTAAIAFVASRRTLISGQPAVELLNVQLPIPPRAARAAGPDMVRSFYKAESAAVLAPALARLKKAAARADGRYVVGSPGREISVAARQSDIDLLVMGSHGRSAFKGLLFGSVVNTVLASCTTPVLLVRASTAPAQDSLTVGIALDGSGYGPAALRYVTRHRALFGASPRFFVIHVVPDYTMRFVPGFGDARVTLSSPQQIVDAQVSQFEKVVAPARQLIGRAGLTMTEVCLVGQNAGDELAKFASRKGLDLLVLGSRGLGALKSLVLGSVATRVAGNCKVPLLLIRQKSGV